MLVTLTESEEYFEARPFSEEWLALSNSEKNKFLTMASNKIEKLPFIGQKESDGQTTLFPRIIKTSSGVTFSFLSNSFGGNYITIVEIPNEVKWAVFEEAFAIYKYMDEERYKLREQGVAGASRGGLSEDYEKYRPLEELLSALAKFYLQDWLVQSAKI